MDYNKIYTLSIPYTVLLLASGAVVWCLLKRGIHPSGSFRGICLPVFLVWLYTVMDITLLSRTGGDYNVSLMPLSQFVRFLSGENREMLRSFWMNVLLFTPCGFALPELLPDKAPPRMRMYVTGGCAFLLSSAIEFMQWYLRLGETETDDVIANVAGALLGMLLVRFAGSGMEFIEKHVFR